MTAALLEIDRLAKSFGGVRATDDVTLSVRAGECHAVIGPNGAGKTTLIAQIAGSLKPDTGEIRLAGRRIERLPAHARARLGLARSFQVTSLVAAMSALDNVALAVQAQQGHPFRFWAPARADGSLREPALAALERVGLRARAHDPAGRLSHGERRQLEIAMATAARPSLLLLDEPMAGMGAEESARTIETLQDLKRETTMVLVEHDMDAVFALADRITVLVYGRVIATGEPAAIRANEDVRHAYLGEA